ncbi:hypothetical protein [Nocardia sp. NPDC004604]|uniref:hypothetical protein n=1 Tax=Nocardia sp. NPDC004604 TaxID=3157013 RepID=UPI0033BB61EA
MSLVSEIRWCAERAGLSYRRAAELFDEHTLMAAGGPFTLHRFRHSALTQAAADVASTPMLMKMSGHVSVRSLGKYARPSAEALTRWRAETDPAAHATPVGRGADALAGRDRPRRPSSPMTVVSPSLGGCWTWWLVRRWCVAGPSCRRRD